MNYTGPKSLSTFLTHFFTLVLAVGILASAVLLIGFVTVFASPQKAIFSYMPDFGLVYHVDAPELEEQLKIESHHPAFDSVKLRLLTDVEIRPAGRYILFLYELIVGLMVAAGLYIVLLLRNLFRSFARNQVFTVENAKRLRRVGWTVILVHLFLLLMGAAVLIFLRDPVTLKGITLSLDPRLTMTHIESSVKALFLGMIILIVAAIHHQGVLLREDRDLTV